MAEALELAECSHLEPLRVAAVCFLAPDSRWPGHIPPQEAR